MTARTVVPLDVLKGGRCTEIRFNPVAKTLLKKALNATLDRAVTASQRPSAATLDLVIASSNGDVRAATNCLQFVVQDPTTKLVAPVSTKGKKAKASKKSTANEARMCVIAASHSTDACSARMISARESSLFLFHALGKILYSKRRSDVARAR